MLAPFLLLASAPLGAMAGDILKTNGYSSCLTGNPDIKVNKLDIEFDRSTKKVKFDVSGTNEKEQKVMATLTVNAYGKEVYKNTFDPCEGESKVDQLCPGTRCLNPSPFYTANPCSAFWYLWRPGRAKHPR
jgi:hypothetical protein